MNFFEFLTELINFSYLGFGHFIVAFIMTGLVGIMLVAMLGAVAKFQLFNFNKSKKEDDQLLKLRANPSDATPQQSNIYDMLVDAYDRYKAKKNNKGTDEGKE